MTSSCSTFSYWIMPIGRSLGIKSTKAKAPIPNKTLEITYSKMSKLNHKTVSLCSFLFYFLSTIFVCHIPIIRLLNERKKKLNDRRVSRPMKCS